MRYALDRIAREAKDGVEDLVPRPALQKYLKVAAGLMLAGVDHALAAQICGALHAGSASASEDADAWRVAIDDVVHDKAYGALEMIGAAKRPSIDFATLMFYWIRIPSSVPNVVNRIAGSVTRRHELLSYDYHAELAEQLAKHVPGQPHLLPPKWTFAWGAENETTLLTNALALRCIYHLLAVHFGAGANDLRGGGLSNLLLVISRDQLLHDLRLMTSLSEAKTRDFCRFLTWGSQAVTPDPALQPIIPLGSGRFAIPCIHLLSSDQERNLLSLLARTDPGSFHSQSHFFETEMIGTFLGCALPRVAGLSIPDSASAYTTDALSTLSKRAVV